MEKITYTEIFYSLQGEGRWAGVPSVFFRTYGCNFRCRKFGRTDDFEGHNPEVVDIIEMVRAEPEKYKRFEDLPLVTSGCDTYASIYPEFKKFNRQDDVPEIVDQMHAMIPHGRWDQDCGSDTVHLVITGGEPLLGYQRRYPEMLELCRAQGLRDLTFETNGSQWLYPEVKDYLFDEFTRTGRDYDRLTFSVSPKLSASGEAWAEAIKPEIVADYQNFGTVYLKFVIDSEVHFEEVDRAVAAYRAAGFEGVVYVMPQGGVVAPYAENRVNVADWALVRGYYYTPRLHVDLWGNGWGK